MIRPEAVNFFKSKNLPEYITTKTETTIEVTIKDLEKELEYTPENALALMKSSGDFDSFVTETATELENFQ